MAALGAAVFALLPIALGGGVADATTPGTVRATAPNQWGCGYALFCAWNSTDGRGDRAYSGGGWTKVPATMTTVWSFWNHSSCKAWIMLSDPSAPSGLRSNEVPPEHRWANQRNYPVYALVRAYC